jgi:putative sigma-54 modulation protein
MKVRITARHFNLTEDLKEFAESRIKSLTRYFDNIIGIHLKLDVEKYRHSADLNATVHGTMLSCSANSNDMYASVDEVVKKMEAQVKKYKSRLKDKDQRKVAETKVPRSSVAETASEETDDYEAGLE